VKASSNILYNDYEETFTFRYISGCLHFRFVDYVRMGASANII
jgi:hypothetical protein